MQRETKKITTPSGHTVEFYTYITGREARELQSIFLKHSKFQTGEDQKARVIDFDPLAVPEAETTALRMLIVSVNDSKDNPVETIENMPSEDYRSVVLALNAITNDAMKPSDFLIK